MRITFVLPNANLLGGTRVIAIYAERLQRRGHEVTILSTPPRPHRLRTRVRAVMNGRGWMPQRVPGPSHLDGLPLDHRVLDRWRPVCDSDVPDGDVVIATWWETAPWVAALCEAKGAKAYFVQDYGAHEGQPLDRVAETWRLPLHKFTISQWLSRLIQETTGQAGVRVIHNSVDTGLFFAPPRGRQARPTVGLSYSRRPQKNCAMAIEAIERARQSEPTLEVVSFGHEEPDDALPLPGGTRFTVNAPEAVLRDLYSSCDAWLFSSRLEGFGLPILEAMACRTPVIGTPAGAAPELLEGGGGMLVESDGVESMADAIVRIARMPEAEWREMSLRAYQTATGHTWNDAVCVFEEELQRAVKVNRPGAVTVPGAVRS